MWREVGCERASRSDSSKRPSWTTQTGEFPHLRGRKSLPRISILDNSFARRSQAASCQNGIPDHRVVFVNFGGLMTQPKVFACLVILGGLFSANLVRANDDIPKAAWKRPIGAPLADAGTKKPALDSGHIDNGFWQGAPVGGFGAGTFSRTYRGDFARWHMKAGVHKYQTVWANQFAMFQQTEGDAR